MAMTQRYRSPFSLVNAKEQGKLSLRWLNTTTQDFRGIKKEEK
jgi:hypothetical protein